MRTITVCAILLLHSISMAYAQESKTYLKLKSNLKYSEGYVINSDSVKVKGLIKNNIMDETKLYSIVNFVGVDGSKKKYHPYEIKGYGFGIENFVSDNISFYKVIQSGKKAGLYFKMISVRNAGFGGPGMAPTAYYTADENFYVRKKGTNDFKYVRKRKFVEEFSEYFSNCEKVKLKIQSKELTHKDIESIVREYNNCK